MINSPANTIAVISPFKGLEYARSLTRIILETHEFNVAMAETFRSSHRPFDETFIRSIQNCRAGILLLSERFGTYYNEQRDLSYTMWEYKQLLKYVIPVYPIHYQNNVECGLNDGNKRELHKRFLQQIMRVHTLVVVKELVDLGAEVKEIINDIVSNSYQKIA